MIIYNAKLDEFISQDQSTNQFIQAPKIVFKGIEWMKVNATKSLSADSIFIILDSLQLDYSLFNDKQIPSMDALNRIKSDFVSISVGKTKVSHIVDIDRFNCDALNVIMKDVDFSFKSNRFDYQNPTIEILNAFTSYEGFDVNAVEIVANEEKITLKEGSVAFKNTVNTVIFSEVQAELDIMRLDVNKVINRLMVKASYLKIQEDFLTDQRGSELEGLLKKSTIDVDKIDVLYAGSTKKKIELGKCYMEVNDLNLARLSDFSLSSNTFKVGKMIYHDLNEFTVQTGAIRVNSRDIKIEDLDLRSRMTRQQLTVGRHKKNTLYQIAIGNIVLNSDVIQTYRKKEVIQADHLSLNRLNAVIYTDNNVVLEPRPRKVISQFFKDMALKINIPLVDIKNASISYDLRAERRTDYGNIFVKNINGTIQNFCNIPSDLAQKPIMKTSFEGLLMGNAPYASFIDFNMVDAQNSYTYKGKLTDVHFEDVNRMLEDLTAVRVKRGEFDELIYDVKANKYRSDGTLEFYYKGLKLKYVEERTTGIPDPFHRIVNTLLLRQNNRRDRDPKIAKVSTRHLPEHTTIRCIWEGIFNGLQYSLLPKVPKPLKRFAN